MIRRTWLLAFCLLAPWAAHADALQDTLDRFASLSGFSCTFEQTLTFADGSVRRFQGELAVRRPKRFRWQYRTPYVQWYVSDGRRIWHYEPDLEQVEVGSDLAAVDPVVMRLLSGDIGTNAVRILARPAPRQYRLRLGSGPTVLLGLTNDGLIAFVESMDALGNRNRIMLHDWRLKPPPAAAFVFRVPPGVDVVHLR